MKNTLFVWQMFIPLPEGGDLHRELFELIRKTPEHAGYAAKNAFHTDLCRRIAAQSAYFSRGVWDYVEDPKLAQIEYEKWTRGTADDAKNADYAIDAYRTPKRFMFVTVLALLLKGSRTDAYIAERCNIQGSAMWTRATFEQLLTSFQNLNFLHLRSDAVYLRPGTEDEGVTQEELAEPHYAYLKEVI